MALCAIVDSLESGPALRDYFLRCKADGAGGLSPVREDNAAARKTGRKGGLARLINYIY